MNKPFTPLLSLLALMDFDALIECPDLPSKEVDLRGMSKT